MKILIISLPRSGSTTMLKTLAEIYNLKIIFEPFPLNMFLNYLNKSVNEKYSFEENNIVVKTLVGQIPNEKNINNYIDWMVKFSKCFDKVILLSRRDLIACIESLSYLTDQSKNTILKRTSTSEYFYQKPSEYVYEKCKSYITEANITINKISEILKIPIIYYEDIYDLNSPNRLRKSYKIETKSLI